MKEGIYIEPIIFLIYMFDQNLGFSSFFHSIGRKVLKIMLEKGFGFYGRLSASLVKTENCMKCSFLSVPN